MQDVAEIDTEVAIVGAGFAGMGMAIKLQEAGIDSFTIFERDEEVGGTWRDNTYPGCACDVPSHLYSFSFELNPRWSRTYSPQEEIQDYLIGCAEKYGLYERIRFNTEIVRAEYDEETALWTLVSDDGSTFVARHLVLGVGPLRDPNVPDVEGLQDYEGHWFHSARWDHDAELQGKRVGVVGTGASAVQIVPSIADEAGEVVVFQRSAPWVLPRPEYAYSEAVKQLFERFPAVQRLYRALIYLRHEVQGMGLVRFHWVLEILERMLSEHIDETFEDPVLRRKVTPDYRVGCKRVVVSNDYYPALKRSDVHLVDAAVDRFTPQGVVDAHGQEHELDVVVMATGYAIEEMLAHVEITGRGGQTLEEAWADGMEAYYGVATAGFPNMYMLVGPNTGLGHNSIIFMIESQIRLILQAIETVSQEGGRAIEVRPDAHREFNRGIQQRLRDTVWSTGGCHSWYLTDDGDNYTLWPGLTLEFWLRTRQLDRDAWRVS